MDDLDWVKIEEAALALLSLTSHDEGRVWKSIDWDVMDRLHERGWIADPRGKAKSVWMTPKGQELAEQFLEKHFSKAGAS